VTATTNPVTTQRDDLGLLTIFVPACAAAAASPGSGTSTITITTGDDDEELAEQQLQRE